jgi:hypothetical protein|tara:strand:- start:5900 stop:6217 length:318 start_codon:yes stop_codon:yes gene_type:complete
MENKAVSNIKVGQVYTLKIFSGEEVVAKVEAIEDGWLELSDPVSLAPSQTGMALVPSVFSANATENVRLNSNSVSFVATTADEVKDKYREATTGIQVQEKKILTG